MSEGLFRKTIEAGAQVATLGLDAARVKARVGQAVEEGVIAARRAAKQGRYAAEDLLDEATHCVKKNPLSAVAVSFWAGFGLGVLAVWLGSHDHKA
jgi:ElaB/YqjD/DUF883 family membrane-anchored ribosome-binding protein